MKNEKIIKICEQKFIYLNYSSIKSYNYKIDTNLIRKYYR